MINSFTGEHRFLSNFWPAEVQMYGVTYPTVEHAYQASKTTNPKLRETIRACATPAETKRKGKQLIITRGIPKSGKTTYAKKVFPAAYYCSADDYHVTTEGKYEFKTENLGEAHKQCYFRCYSELDATKWWDEYDRPTIVVDNTNIHAWEISPYVAMANLFGYDHKIVWVKTPIEVCLKRDNNHRVPDWKLGMMYQSIMNEKLPPFWNQEIITN